MTLTAASDAIACEPGRTAVPLQTVAALCEALQNACIRYCHWKSNNALDRSASGDNDLDLLVARADSLKFAAVLAKCGFKLAHAPAHKRMPGVQDYFAYHHDADKWVHVHAHCQLIAGHDLTKNYRVAIEEAYLESAVQHGIFKVPAPEFELLVFVIRMLLKHGTWAAIIGGEGRLKPREQQELLYLQSRVDLDRMNIILERHLPFLRRTMFWEWLDALASDSAMRCLRKAGRGLEKSLRAHARRKWQKDFAVMLTRRIALAVRRRIRRVPPKYSLATGGAAIALVGGDGAGKSTAADGLDRWLSSCFATARVHLGKPASSLLTIAIRAFLKVGNWLGLYGTETSGQETLKEKSFVSPGYPWLLREVCRARDRYWTYVRARRRAANGEFVIFDRFPLAQVELMDGPLTRKFVRDLADAPGATRLRPRADSLLVKYVIWLEESYYKRILAPDLLLVLRVDADTAVRRKPEEKASFVRERSAEIWRLKWHQTGAHVIDGCKSKNDVLNELKTLIWAQL